MPKLWLKCFLSILLLAGFDACASSIKHWAISDVAGKGDKDDRSALSWLMLAAGAFDLRGVTVGAGTYSGACEAKQWADQNLLPSYVAEKPNLEAVCGAYPSIEFIQSNTCRETFKANIDYSSRASIQTLVNEVLNSSPENPLYISLWGPTTEAAALVKTLADTNLSAINNMILTGHGTSSGFNYKEDTAARDYLQSMIFSVNLKFYETGPVGQRGLIEAKPAGCDSSGSFINRTEVSRSRIGALMNAPVGKWNAGEPNPDASDSIAWWILPPFNFADGGISNSNFLANGIKGQLAQTEVCSARALIFPLVEQLAHIAEIGLGTCPLPIDGDSSISLPSPENKSKSFLSWLMLLLGD